LQLPLLRADPYRRAFPQADVAQLVEQPIRNRQVTGSSPVVGSIRNFCRGLASASLAFLKIAQIPETLDLPEHPLPLKRVLIP
jgi:hypothetical protein